MLANPILLKEDGEGSPREPLEDKIPVCFILVFFVMLAEYSL